MLLKKRSAVAVSIVSVLSGALILSGCASLGPSNSASDTPSQTPSPTPVYVTAPLTGLKFLEGTNPYLAGPAVMGKIDNSPEARPQVGLNQADIVFDEMVEGGMTRLLAVWHSQLPEQFGPVRSVRPMDPDIASPFIGILCFSGGQAAFVQAMAKTRVFSATETNQQADKTFKRVTDRFAPHNVFVHAIKLQRLHPDIAAPEAQFSYADTMGGSSAFMTGSPVKLFTVNFPAANPTWTWSATANAWLRSYDNDKHVDAFDGSQVFARNVVVLKTKIDRSYKDYKYGNVPRTILIGGGSGYVFSGGKKISVTWVKNAQNDSLQLLDSKGQEVVMTAGNTWFELMPKDVGNLDVVAPKPTATPTATPSK